MPGSIDAHQDGLERRSDSQALSVEVFRRARLPRQKLRGHPTQEALMTTNRVHHQDPSPDPADTNTHRIVAEMEWDPTEVVFHVETTEPGTPLDDLLRAKQTEVLLELLSEARKKGDLPEH
jgi:hypothetical protein